MTDRLEDAQEKLRETITATGKNPATLAIETATGVRVMIMMLQVAAGQCIEEAGHYRTGGDAHRACMTLAGKFLKDAKLFKEQVSWMTSADKSLKVMNAAHPKPS